MGNRFYCIAIAMGIAAFVGTVQADTVWVGAAAYPNATISEVNDASISFVASGKKVKKSQDEVTRIERGTLATFNQAERFAQQKLYDQADKEYVKALRLASTPLDIVLVTQRRARASRLLKAASAPSPSADPAAQDEQADSQPASSTAAEAPAAPIDPDRPTLCPKCKGTGQCPCTLKDGYKPCAECIKRGDRICSRCKGTGFISAPAAATEPTSQAAAAPAVLATTGPAKIQSPDELFDALKATAPASPTTLPTWREMSDEEKAQARADYQRQYDTWSLKKEYRSKPVKWHLTLMATAPVKDRPLVMVTASSPRGFQVTTYLHKNDQAKLAGLQKGDTVTIEGIVGDYRIDLPPEDKNNIFSTSTEQFGVLLIQPTITRD
jgi:hypothetical protein